MLCMSGSMLNIKCIGYKTNYYFIFLGSLGPFLPHGKFWSSNLWLEIGIEMVWFCLNVNLTTFIRCYIWGSGKIFLYYSLSFSTIRHKYRTPFKKICNSLHVNFSIRVLNISWSLQIINRLWKLFFTYPSSKNPTTLELQNILLGEGRSLNKVKQMQCL